MTSLCEYKQFWSTNKEKKVPYQYLVLNDMADMSEEELAEKGFFPVVDARPDFDEDTECLVETKLTAKGKPVCYYQQYKVVALPEEKLVENLNNLRATVVAEILNGADAVASEYMNQFSDIERATWDKQEAEVTAWEADSSAKTPMMDALAAMRGITREEMLEKAANKVNLFKMMATVLIGRQQAMEDAVKAIVGDSKTSTAEKIIALRTFEVSY